MRVISSIDELKNCSGIYGIAYVEVPRSEIKIDDLNEKNNNGNLINFDNLNSPMTPPPKYEASPEYREDMKK